MRTTSPRQIAKVNHHIAPKLFTRVWLLAFVSVPLCIASLFYTLHSQEIATSISLSSSSLLPRAVPWSWKSNGSGENNTQIHEQRYQTTDLHELDGESYRRNKRENSTQPSQDGGTENQRRSGYQDGNQLATEVIKQSSEQRHPQRESLLQRPPQKPEPQRTRLRPPEHKQRQTQQQPKSQQQENKRNHSQKQLQRQQKQGKRHETTTDVPREPPQRLPPSLSRIHFLSATDARISKLAARPFTSPCILTSYIRPSSVNPGRHDLFLFTNSLFRRNLTAENCILFPPEPTTNTRGGNSSSPMLVPVDSHIDDVVMCVLPALPAAGTRISVTIQYNEALHASLRGSVDIAHGYDTSLRSGDVKKVILPTDRRGDNGAGKMHYTIASDVHFDPRLVDNAVALPPFPKERDAHKLDYRERDAPPRFQVCLATMNRIGSHMLPDWVDHHRRLGFDHVYVLDNGARPPIAATPLGRRADVEVVAWPWQKSQLSAFSFLLLAARARCERLMLSDVDEFLMLGLGKQGSDGKEAAPSSQQRPIVELIARAARNGFRNILVHTLVMVNSGHVRRQTGHVAEAYVHASVTRGEMYGKMICITDMDWRAGAVHACGLLKSRRQLTKALLPDMAKVRGQWWPRTASDPPVLVHFYERSWEERVEKFRTGRGSFRGGVHTKFNRSLLMVDDPDPEYVRVEGCKEVVRYTYFRDYWRRLRRVKGHALLERVVVAIVNGRRVTRVVRIGK